jgi:DNA-binding beta-propeller fold protein YncE
MFDIRSYSKILREGWVVLALALAVLVSGVLWQAGAQKNKRTAEQIVRPPLTTFDITKIVWPSPPEIPRVKFEAILTGQKVDWAELQNPKKPKRSWMDRLAGAGPDQQIANAQQKIGFQLMRPYGVAVDSEGNIYVGDQGVGAIFIFPKSAAGKLQLIKNRVDAPLPMINGLAIDDQDRMFVTDVKLHHVLVFNKEHQPTAEFGGGVLVSPAGIAIDNDNRFVYVVDTQQDEILVFDADEYTLLRRIGTSGKQHTLTTPGNFALPTNVAVDKDGNVYVTDTLNDRVEVLDADGDFISQFGTPGDGPGHFARPKGIAIDRDGHIWVADEVQSRVQVFDKQGRLLIYFGELGWYPGQFQALYGIASDDSHDRMITTEQFPGRVQVFRYVKDAEAAALTAQRENQAKTSSSVANPSAKTAADSEQVASGRAQKPEVTVPSGRQDAGAGKGSRTAPEQKKPANPNLIGQERLSGAIANAGTTFGSASARQARARRRAARSLPAPETGNDAATGNAQAAQQSTLLKEAFPLI